MFKSECEYGCSRILFVESYSVSCSSAGSDVETWETSSLNALSKPTWFEMIVEEMLF